MNAYEVNFDGLVGPTHNYAGLSLGNLASKKYANQISHPRAAALQGLQKMHLLLSLGIKQGILPPHERPHFDFLYHLGFRGTPHEVLRQVHQNNPALFKAAYSASSMWVANAATVSPSCDTLDNRVHITPANRVTHLHRALEATENYHFFKKLFSDEKYFQVHSPLIPQACFADEGAANHIRLASNHAAMGWEGFVYGRSAFLEKEPLPKLFPARQTKEASEAIDRVHQLSKEKTFFVKQNPAVIDKGVFHNDVISVTNENVFLYHEEAFENAQSFLGILKKTLPFPVYFIPVSREELSVEEAVKTYLFNSQLVTCPDGTMCMIAPIEAEENKAAHDVLKRIQAAENPIQKIYFVDCRQSMQNGGGPACLRLRIVLTEAELAATQKGVLLTEALYQQLVTWVNKHYREKLAPEDLLDPKLIEESRAALDELTHILQLGSLYRFQKT